MKPTGPTNPQLQQLIAELRTLSREQKVDIWKKVAHDLSVATRRKHEVNVWKLAKYAKPDEVLLVPGKVLSTGASSKKIKVAAWQFSPAAKQKVDAITIEHLMKENPKGKHVRIIV